eukprot:m.480038 g.480038  ORF g.480038 m.480038 type:complete len:55 (+) comp51537_c0_seq1:896-1060(+)
MTAGDRTHARFALKTLLLDHSKHLAWATRLRFATDIARGMNYLHQHCSPRFELL